MTEIPSASCLAAWLGDKPPEFACVLAARNRTAGGTDTEKHIAHG